MARQTTVRSGSSQGDLRGRRRAQRISALLGLLSILFGVVSPGPAVAAPVVPPAGSSVTADGHHGSHDGRSHDQGDHSERDTVTDAGMPHLVRDTIAERHAAQPAGGAALSGSAYVPRPPVEVWSLPDAPVADGDLLRAARYLGRSPPLPPGN